MEFRIKSTYGSYFNDYYNCPACGVRTPLTKYSYYCNDCNKSIVDVYDLVNDLEYAIRYHFGLIDEIKTFTVKNGRLV